MRGARNHLVDKSLELLKFSLTIALMGFFILKAPAESEKIITLATGFILGGSKLGTAIGLN